MDILELRDRSGAIPDEVDDVRADRFRHVHLLHRPLHLDERRRVDDWLEADLVRAPLEPPLEHLQLALARRVADADPDEEAVELRLRQRVGALVLDRVLRREHDERTLERVRLALGQLREVVERLDAL